MLQKSQWKAAFLLGASYLFFMWFSEHFIPHPSTLFPASAIALSVLFLEGLELWPVVYLASLVGSIIAGFPLAFLVVLPVAQTIQAATGAWLMKKAPIDPLFRRFRDIFLLICIILLVSLIVPTLTSFANILSTGIFNAPYHLVPWGLRYTGMVFCLLVLTPFLLRWFAKPRFSRTGAEVFETVFSFLILIAIDSLFLTHISVVGGIPVVYFMLIPLFWIALRLRPRFVTLAMLITSIFAILSLYVGAMVPLASEFGLRLFQTEEFLIVLAIIFFIIVSLEESRRLSSNLLRSQVATLENAVVRISSESSAKNDFIAVLAHELRNPLAPVVTAIDLLKLREDRTQEELETLVMMENRMQMVRRLLDDLLDISRITEGKLSLKKEPVDLEIILKRAVLSTEHSLKERHQSLTLTATKKPVFIMGDPVRIEQIFTNLLTNASKYSDSGDQIRLSLSRHDDTAEIIVSDTGVGLEPEILDKIFTPFHQAEPGMRSKKGLGIGLALVRSFVEMHGGTVVATSKGPGHGSQFTVRLPLMPDSALTTKPARSEASPERKRATAAENKAKNKGGLSVLVVDDNDAAAWSMGRLLELKGCNVSYAYDGRQAIDQAAELTPDVILLDLGLPDQDGYDVAKTIRARGYHGRLIALTGFSTEEAKTKGKHAGFEHYLVKPAGFADLKRVIPEIA